MKSVNEGPDTEDKRINDEIINEARSSLEGMTMQNYGNFTEFQIYLMDRINLDLTTLKDSLRKESIK